MLRFIFAVIITFILISLFGAIYFNPNILGNIWHQSINGFVGSMPDITNKYLIQRLVINLLLSIVLIYINMLVGKQNSLILVFLITALFAILSFTNFMHNIYNLKHIFIDTGLVFGLLITAWFISKKILK
jgi:hypothetical protein